MGALGGGCPGYLQISKDDCNYIDFHVETPPLVCFIVKDPDSGKDWRQEEKWVTEDEMDGWHCQLNGHEFEQTPGDSEGQGSLISCSPWGHKESEMTVTEQQQSWITFQHMHVREHIRLHCVEKSWGTERKIARLQSSRKQKKNNEWNNMRDYLKINITFHITLLSISKHIFMMPFLIMIFLT